MADNEITDLEFDGEEFELDIDNTMADFQGGWFLLEITDTQVTQQVHPKYGKSISARLSFQIVDDEALEGTYVSTFLPLNSKSVDAAQKRAAFINALTGDDATGKVKLTVAKQVTTEGSEKVILKDVLGMRVGAYVVIKNKFLNIDGDKFVSPDELDKFQTGDDEDPFEVDDDE